jgi:transcriptional antiterminator RfaH
MAGPIASKPLVSASVQALDGGSPAQWYLLRTKVREERRAELQLWRFATGVLLPLAKAHVSRLRRAAEGSRPLFPGYVFARLELERDFAMVRYTRGIREIVRFGAEAAIVPGWIISEIVQRCSCGPIELPKPVLVRNQRLIVTDGPLRNFEAIFERYLPGSQRIAILLSAMSCGARAVLPENMVAPI